MTPLPFQCWGFKPVLHKTIEFFKVYKLMGDSSDPYCWVVYDTMNETSKHLVSWDDCQKHMLNVAKNFDDTPKPVILEAPPY